MKVAILIDGNALFHAAKSVNVKIDYVCLLDYLTGEHDLLKAVLYMGVRTDDGDAAQSQQGFLHWARCNGMKVVESPLKSGGDGKFRSSVDVEITTDAMSLMGSADEIILVSGSGNFSYLLDRVSGMGTRISVAMFKATTSRELRAAADSFYELDEAVHSVAVNPEDYSTEDSFTDDGEYPEGY